MKLFTLTLSHPARKAVVLSLGPLAALCHPTELLSPVLACLFTLETERREGDRGREREGERGRETEGERGRERERDRGRERERERESE